LCAQKSKLKFRISDIVNFYEENSGAAWPFGQHLARRRQFTFMISLRAAQKGIQNAANPNLEFAFLPQQRGRWAQAAKPLFCASA
jgi:hypothetical protein